MSQNEIQLEHKYVWAYLGLKHGILAVLEVTYVWAVFDFCRS